MKKIFILICFFFFHSQIFGDTQPKTIRGFLDLSNYEVNDHTVFTLDGEWEFYWKQFLVSEPPVEPNFIPINVPGIWNGYFFEQRRISGDGYGTYRLQLVLPKGTKYFALYVQELACAYRLYVDRELILSVGRVDSSAEKSFPQFKPDIAYFYTENSTVEILLEVANFSHPKGGFWESAWIGSVKAIHNYREDRIGFDLFLTGSLLMMGIYHFGLYSLRRKDKSSFYLGGFCFLMILRILTTGNRIFFVSFEFLSWEVGMKLEYLTFYLGTPVFAKFVHSLYPNEFKKVIMNIISYVSLGFSLLVLLTKTKTFAFSAIPFQIFTVCGLFYIIYVLILAISNSRQGSLVALIGFMVLFITIINDILYNNAVINTAQLTPFGLFGFIFSQALILSIRFSKDLFSVENLTENLTKTTQSYSRFIPKEFLSYLEDNQTQDNQKPKKDITILFCNIRSADTNEDQLNSESSIHSMNEFIRHINPIIRQNKGFIDRYVGNAIMTIFPIVPDDAVSAALNIIKYLEDYNRKQKNKNMPSLKIGIGIHTDNLSFSNTENGDGNEGTFLTDATDLAARIEGFTKIYGSTIIVSEQTIVNFIHAENYHFRFLGRVEVKGKPEPSPIFEIYNLDSPDVLQKKNSTKVEFEKAVIEYYKGNKEIAFQSFQKIFQINKYDLATYYFLQKCKISQSFTENHEHKE